LRRRLDQLGKDFYGGALMATIGLAVIWQSRHYAAGTLSRMGPGFFPISLGAILTLIGIAIAVVGIASNRTAGADKAAPPPEWKAWFLISASIVAFIVLAKYGGLLPATFAIVFISALADRGNSWRSAVAIAAAMSVIAAVVFWWALQLQLPLFQWG
jgi:hypothetical protein